MKRIKILAVILVAVIVLPLLTSCLPLSIDRSENAAYSPTVTNSNSTQQNEVSNYLNATGLPITKEKITIKAMGKKNNGAAEWSELEIFKKAEELTNIHFDFDLAEASVYNEKKNLALVSGDYPEVFLREISVNDEEIYGPQGVFINLKPLIEEYAPNLKKRLKENPAIKSAITAIDGSIYGAPYSFATSTTNNHMSFINSTWLERAGVEMPKDTEDLYNMLKAFKEKDANGNGDPNDEIPWSCRLYNAFDQFILPAFTGLSGGSTFDVQDGKVVFTPALPVFKEYLTYINRLWEENLIDHDFLTQTSQQHLAKVKMGIVGVYNASPTNLPPETTDLQISLECITSPYNDKKVTKPEKSIYSGNGVITDKCRYPEAVMRWMDIWYAKPEEATEGLYGNVLFVGLENVHWKYADPEKKSYCFIEPITSLSDINKLVSVTMYLPSYLHFMAYPANNPLMEMKVKGVLEHQVPYEKSYFPATARYTKEEFERASLFETDINNHVLQMVTKFVTGDEPIDNFDKYVDTLKNMKLDELTAIKQSVYDRWVRSAE